jgi:eukaryotic-like serine/threonine-protein kinase
VSVASAAPPSGTSEFVEQHRSPAAGSEPSGPSLPSGLLASAPARLSIAAFLYAVAYTVAYLPGFLMGSMGPDHLATDLVAAGFVAGSVAVGFAARRLPLPAERVVDLGLLYEIAGAVGIEISILWWIGQVAAVSTGISWVCVWVVIFPLIVPATPGKAFLAAVASASVRPLLLLIAAARGEALPPFEVLALMTIPNYVCAGLAVAVAKVVYGWGVEVSRARRMGSYHLVERLGEGGMGEVWRAEHRMLARPAAIKLVRPEGFGSNPFERQTLMRRFEREARATAALSSPHTIQLFDYGISPDGTFYYVMELLRGVDLERFVERFGPMPAARAAYVLRQACLSLDEAHTQGMIHRDVKPANVYLCRVGREHDFVKLLDFGLVKSVAGNGPREAALTAAHMAAGTPAFMAPEMATGESRIDGRADLYALGCVGYWLVTGHQVFDERSPMRLMLAHAHNRPERPSRRSEVHIPGAFEELLMACLSKNPADRPQTAEALGTALAGLAVEWTQDDADKWWRTHMPEFAA